jgi:hypothetical protein
MAQAIVECRPPLIVQCIDKMKEYISSHCHFACKLVGTSSCPLHDVGQHSTCLIFRNFCSQQLYLSIHARNRAWVIHLNKISWSKVVCVFFWVGGEEHYFPFRWNILCDIGLSPLPVHPWKRERRKEKAPPTPPKWTNKRKHPKLLVCPNLSSK